MGCIDGIDPADFETGIFDPGDVVSPDGSELTTDVGDDFFAAGYITFEVNVSPINYIDAVEFDFSTSNGTATAGTHYTARTGVHVTIPAGTGLYVGQINVLKSSSFHGDKTLTVTISGAVNATIADATAVLTIHYEPKPPVTDPDQLDHYTSWPEKVSVYNQFPRYPDACTAFATSALTSLHEYLDQGRQTRFDAPDLFSDSGCCGAVLTLHVAKSTGVKVEGGSRRRKINAWGEIDGSSKEDLIKRIKRAIHKYGGVQVESIWYTQYHAGNNTACDWNYTGLVKTPHDILPDPDNFGGTRSCLGHDTVLVGWDNNISGTGIGGFRIQSSMGSSWGRNGRAWLAYKTIKTRRFRGGGVANCNGATGGPSGYDISEPWFRFYWAELKRGG